MTLNPATLAPQWIGHGRPWIRTAGCRSSARTFRVISVPRSRTQPPLTRFNSAERNSHNCPRRSLASGRVKIATMIDGWPPTELEGKWTMVTVGILATLKAKSGKEQELAEFLTSALPLAEGEPETTVWFAIKLDDS